MSAYDWARLRAAEWPRLEGLAYLDHALRGPVPARARRALAFAAGVAELGRVVRGQQAAAAEVARSAIAGLLGWEPERLAFTTNTTTAVALLAQGVRWRPGERVIVHADEVPGNILPWRALAARGVEVEVLPSREGRLALEDLEAACRERPPRWVSLAAVALGTGQRRDVAGAARVAHGCGARLVVDVAQALGALAVGAELQAVDAIVGCGRKWLCGPPEAGFLGVRPEVLEELEVVSAGAGSLREGSSGGWVDGARRLEGGVLPLLPLIGLAESAQLLQGLDAGAVEARVLARAEEVREGARSAGWRVLSPGGPAEGSGIVWLELPRAVQGLEAALEERGVIVRVQGARLRVSPHAWTTTREVERLLREVRAALG